MNHSCENTSLQNVSVENLQVTHKMTLVSKCEKHKMSKSDLFTSRTGIYKSRKRGFFYKKNDKFVLIQVNCAKLGPIMW